MTQQTEVKTDCPLCSEMHNNCFVESTEIEGEQFDSYICFQCGMTSNSYLAFDSEKLEEYTKKIQFSLYAGFNALFFDGTELVYCHHEKNKTPEYYSLEKGIYGLSNAKLNTPWPKVEKTKTAFHTLANNESHELSAKHLFSFLRDDKFAEDELLPNTGVGMELERMLSPAFIISPSYGTRTATAVIIDNKENQQSVYFNERQFSNKGESVRELIKRLHSLC